MTHKKSHEKEIHFVVAYNTKTGRFAIDYDGTDVWIRSLFSRSQTYCYQCEEFEQDFPVEVRRAEKQLATLLGEGEHNA
jgi:hypothetical protein